MNAIDSLDIPDAAPWKARALFRLLSRLHAGRLVLITPEGIRRTYEGESHGPHAHLEIRDWRAIGAMARGAEIGVFESWRDGLIATPDMAAFLELCALNQVALARMFYGHPLSAWLLRIAHALRPNTRSGARRNIHAHYDLGNEFYSLWLDPGMTYSSALFAGDYRMDMARAQQAKYDRMLDVLDVRPEHHVLEVGCGWGAFAERAAASRGCRVTGLTISRSQLDYARERIRAAGLEGRVDLRFQDYRDAGGVYDRIVSIEMVEAVGERYWPVYFRKLHSLLAPGGRAAVQAIVIAGDAFERYRKSSDFIRERIFPGGMLPSVARFASEARAAGFRVGEPYLFGPDYAVTLRRWRRAFDAQEARVRALGFDDEFLASWRFYLDYCEAGFNAGRIDVIQVELAKAP